MRHIWDPNLVIHVLEGTALLIKVDVFFSNFLSSIEWHVCQPDDVIQNDRLPMEYLPFVAFCYALLPVDRILITYGYFSGIR